jgi:nucleotidyltransferase substrate binding protein (TIGR01987 family)
MSKLEAVIKQFKRALERFEEILKEDKNEIVRDAAIQRFEFTFDLAWKVIKAILEEEKGTVCASPKECFKEAYRNKLLDYDNFWLKMTDLRNKTTHFYKEETANEVYEVFPEVLVYFKKILEIIEK